ncbi:MAG: aminopeptidase P N-terminal domain-containing protein [Bdellovibrionales bacterium]|nr:aminopeptidase P N-terminal domain-containing protein [Bdellovibrionales bacterium]
MASANEARESVFRGRRNSFLRSIKGDCALLIAAPARLKSRDQHYEYFQDQNFLYLTGVEEPGCALVLRGVSSGPRTVLFVRDRDAVAERWQGERLGVRRAKRRFEVDEVRCIEQLPDDLEELVKGSRKLYYGPGVDSELDRFVFSLFQNPTAPRPGCPTGLEDARVILSEMRFVKDRDEIRALKHAADITTHSFAKLAKQLKTFKSEIHCARTLEQYFVELGASGTAFDTIVASGRNAAVLHHHPSHQPLWKRQMLLIDAGARHRGYCADVTRVYPSEGGFIGAQADVYDCVEKALRAACDRVRPGTNLNSIHLAACREITRGLVDMGILEGDVPTLMAEGAYKKYFMHRTSHWLGLDVHDINPLFWTKSGKEKDSYSRPLVAGNVFTVEPGLYFDPNDKTIPEAFRGIGVRLEDDVLVTPGGRTVLTAELPSKRTEVEEMLS